MSKLLKTQNPLEGAKFNKTNNFDLNFNQQLTLRFRLIKPNNVAKFFLTISITKS